MRRTILLTVLFSISFLLFSCFPKKKLTGSDPVIRPVYDTTNLRAGSLVYALPRNVFTVRFEMERSIGLPGPYARYADELLGLKNVLLNEVESWSIKSVSLNSHEEIDPSEFYVIESNMLIHTNALALKKTGLILDINPEYNYTEDRIASHNELSVNQFRSFDLGSDEYYQTLTDTAYRRISVDSSFIRIPYTVEKKKKLTTDQLAERAANRLMEIRDGKILILTGEANVFPQNEAAIKELNKMEKEYTELFTGKTIKETKSYTYNFIPVKEMAGKPVTLFRFSEVTGPSDNSSGSGTPVVIIITPEQKTKDVTLITRNVTGAEPQKSDRIFYRMPDVADIRISSGPETFYNSRKLIYQFGQIMQIPSNYLIGK